MSLYLFLETVKIAIIRTGPPGSAGNGSNVVVVALTAFLTAVGRPGGRGTQRARLVRKKPHRSLAKATGHATLSSPNVILGSPLLGEVCDPIWEEDVCNASSFHTDRPPMRACIPTPLPLLECTLYKVHNSAHGLHRGGSRFLVVDDFHSTLTYYQGCLLYTSPSPRDRTRSRMPSSA